MSTVVRNMAPLTLILSPKCGGRIEIISHISDEDVIWQILNHLGLLEEEPAGSSERAPPEITYEPVLR